MSDEQEIIDCFRLFDKDKSGYIDASELRHIMLNLGDKMSDHEVDEMISDAGGSSKIDYAKFVKSMNKKAKSSGSD